MEDSKLAGIWLVRITDIILVGADFLLAFFAGDWFADHFFLSSGHEAITSGGIVLTSLSVLVVALYVFAIISNTKNVACFPNVKIRYADWIALTMNSILAGGFLPYLLMMALRIQNIVVMVVLVIAVMPLWAWMHSRMFRNAEKGGGVKFNVTRQWIGVISIIPMTLLIMMPFSVVAGLMHENLQGLSVGMAVLQVALFSVLLTVLAWGFSYVPRMVLKLMTGNTYNNRYFFLWLLIDIVLKTVLG